MFDFALFQVASLRLGYIGVKWKKNSFDLAYQLCFFLKRMVAFVFQAHSETADDFGFWKVSRVSKVMKFAFLRVAHLLLAAEFAC
jgi:hypothetical protein